MLATRPLMHTEYLQPLDPLPTTLDAKKSPLALLAQTCSSIGKPDPPPSSTDVKSASTPIGRQSPAGKRSPEKASTGAGGGLPESHITGFKPYKQPEKRDGDALVIKIGYQGKDKGETSSSSLKSPAMRAASSPHSPLLKAKSEPATTPRSSPSTDINHQSGDFHKDHSANSKPVAPVQAAQVAPSHLHHSSYPGHYKHGFIPTSAAHAGHCGCPSQVVGHIPYYPDPAAVAAARDPLGVHKHDVNPLLASTASPYTAYARVKTADGGTTLMPICRDPYCTNCQSAQHYHHSSAPSGCTQCRHDTYALNAPFPIALPLPGSISPYLSSSVAASVHPHPYLYSHPATATSQEHGHVCNWVSGSTSCGKRFASSEELLQHLRTHTMTNSEVPPPTSSAALSATLGAQLSAYYMQYPTAAAAAAAAASFGLPKPVFPSALSPASAIRYHPYSKSPSPIAALPGLPTGAYYSPPYALHDIKSRFATAGVPH